MSFAIPSTYLSRVNIKPELGVIFSERETVLETQEKIKKTISDYLFSLNIHAEPYDPSAKLPTVLSEEPPAAKAGFRNKKANCYRQLVAQKSSRLKNRLLSYVTVSQDLFNCVRCKEDKLLQYARLAHVIPLKSLWLQFEKENGVEMDSNSDEWSGHGYMGQMWKEFHQSKAVLEVICKDCEKIAPS